MPKSKMKLKGDSSLKWIKANISIVITLVFFALGAAGGMAAIGQAVAENDKDILQNRKAIIEEKKRTDRRDREMQKIMRDQAGKIGKTTAAIEGINRSLRIISNTLIRMRPPVAGPYR